MRGKVIKMDSSTKEVEIEVKGKIEKYTVGKAIFNQKKFQVGDNIDYNLKGKNFEFVGISNEELRDTRNNFSNNTKNTLSFGWNALKMFPIPMSVYSKYIMQI